MNGLIITTNLLGRATSVVKKEEVIHQRHGAILLDKKISYNGRNISKCVRKTYISEDILKEWIGSKSPGFVKEFIWKNMSKSQRIKAWVERFDDGYGVEFEIL